MFCELHFIKPTYNGVCWLGNPLFVMNGDHKSDTFCLRLCMM